MPVTFCWPHNHTSSTSRLFIKSVNTWWEGGERWETGGLWLQEAVVSRLTTFEAWNRIFRMWKCLKLASVQKDLVEQIQYSIWLTNVSRSFATAKLKHKTSTKHTKRTTKHDILGRSLVSPNKYQVFQLATQHHSTSFDPQDDLDPFLLWQRARQLRPQHLPLAQLGAAKNGAGTVFLTCWAIILCLVGGLNIWIWLMVSRCFNPIEKETQPQKRPCLLDGKKDSK